MTLFDRAKARIDRAFIQETYPGGKWQGSEYWVCSPLRSDKNPTSFSIRNDGLWNDLATQESGNFFQLLQKTHNIKTPTDAARWVLGENVEYQEPEIRIPLIDNHKKEKAEWATWDGVKYPTGYETAELVTKYLDGDTLAFMVLRHAGKQIRPWYYTPSGWVSGIPEKYNKKRPLFGNIQGDKPVLICEGEKTADKLLHYAHGFCVTTWHGGAQNVEKADWSRLSGKRVYLWPDKDKPGIDAMERLRAILAIENEVYTLDVEKALPDHDDGTDAADLMADDVRAILENKSLWEKKRSSAFGFTRMDAIDMAPPDWLIRDVMDKGTSALLFGDSGSGKSFLAVDMACCIASGKPYHGHAVKSGDVVYIAGEGRKNIRKRFEAWERHNKCKAMHRVFMSNSGADLYADAQDIVLGIKESGIKPALIIIDTLARNMGEGDENATVDMNRFVNGMGILSDGTGAATLVVHHTGHTNKERARGAYALKAAVDWEYRLSEVGDARKLECTKSKDYDFFEPLAFELQEYEFDLGQHTLTSAVLVSCAVPEEKEKTAGRPNASNEALLDCIKAEGPIANPEIVKERFMNRGFSAKSHQRAINHLIKKGDIIVTAHSVSLKYIDYNTLGGAGT